MMEFNVNLIAVLVAAMASMVLGGLWYSPLLFGKPWMRLSGVKPGKGAGKSYAIGFLSAIVMSCVLAQFVVLAKADSVLDAIRLAFWIWLGFFATLTIGGVIWERRPFSLFLLNNAYNLISLAVMSMILALWK